MQKKFLAPAFTALTVFVLSMIALFFEFYDDMNTMVLAICLGYAFLCLVFLIFQLYAFIRAHMDYDEEVEMVKYQVFDAEGMPRPTEELI
jgi:peptidoglycan biosynthesis protein MviN/MurJ (putative lipid II flippase)